jgi:hypothetical protein
VNDWIGVEYWGLYLCQTLYFQGYMMSLFFTFHETPSREGTGKNDLKEVLEQVLGTKELIFVKKGPQPTDNTVWCHSGLNQGGKGLRKR